MGELTITAARDIGIRNGGTAPWTEFLIVTGEGATPLGTYPKPDFDGLCFYSRRMHRQRSQRNAACGFGLWPQFRQRLYRYAVALDFTS
jgi:hypothetical protein